MKARKKWTALLCAVALLLTLVPAPARAGEDYIFIALNDQIPPRLSADTMPIYYYNTYYVPYVIFDRNYMNANYGVIVDLGVYVAANNNKILLYNKRRQLTYDLDAGTCTDKEGNNYKRAAVIGGITYLPIAAVREFFKEDGLNFTQIATDYGPILRLTTPNFWLDHYTFGDAAAMGMADMIKKYNQSQNPSPSPEPSPSPSPSPAPSPSPRPTPPGGEEGDKRGVRVSLSFRCTGGERTAKVLDALDNLNLPALFFFAPEELAENEVLVRRMVGTGHAVGLAVSGDRVDSVSDQLAEGNRLLSLIAHTTTRTALLDNVDSATAIALSGDGWSIWEDNVFVNGEGLTAVRYSAALLRAADAKKAVARIGLGDSIRDLATLSYLIPALRAEHYSLRLAVGSEVGG